MVRREKDDSMELEAGGKKVAPAANKKPVVAQKPVAPV
jgi:hypothetical protein